MFIDINCNRRNENKQQLMIKSNQELEHKNANIIKIRFNNLITSNKKDRR